MKDLTFSTLIAVLEEIFGQGLFWGLVVAALIVTAAYVYVLIRDHHISWRKFLLAQLSMPVGFIAAIWLMLGVTNSHLSDLGGPIDIIMMLAIGTAGAIGAAILVYTVQSLIKPYQAGE